MSQFQGPEFLRRMADEAFVTGLCGEVFRWTGWHRLRPPSRRKEIKQANNNQHNSDKHQVASFHEGSPRLEIYQTPTKVSSAPLTIVVNGANVS